MQPGTVQTCVANRAHTVFLPQSVKAMHPYPYHLVTDMTLADGSIVTIRPIRPEDAEIESDFVRNLSDESRYYRFMDSLHELSPQMLLRLTRVDYDRHLALVAVTRIERREVEIAAARYVVADDGKDCEFAIVVADAWQRKGIGSHLMHVLIDAARHRGLCSMHGDVLASNHRMLAFTAGIGFRALFDPQDPHMMRVEIKLQ
jgi:acetyltransferase